MWESENSERLRYFLKCFLESKSLSLSSALIIDISLQSYGNSCIAGVPEITKPKKEKQAALCGVDMLVVVLNTSEATETACLLFQLSQTLRCMTNPSTETQRRVKLDFQI